MNKRVNDIFFELLQVAIGVRDALSVRPSDAEWAELYALAEKHSLIGIAFAGIEKTLSSYLPHNGEGASDTMKINRPPLDLLMDWLGQSEYIRSQNEAADKACLKAVEMFREVGIDGVVLKGQGIARLYSKPELRTSGDIDYWATNCSPERAIEMARARDVKDTPKYHHVDFGTVDGIAVELHYKPSWFYTPWYNARFQQFCNDNAEFEITNGITHPTLAFNRVYILVHIYRHLFSDGIGLRQLIDYYVVLVSSFKFQVSSDPCAKGQDSSEKEPETRNQKPETSERNPFWAQEKIATMHVLKELGMERFTSAVMWILKDKLGIADECLLCPANGKDGKFLLQEIMQSGNFGHYDERNTYAGDHKATLGRAIGRTKRLLNIFRFGPWEVLWSPLWKIWHIYFWMPRHNKGLKG